MKNDSNYMINSTNTTVNTKPILSAISDKDNLVTNLEFLLAAFVLKYYSSKEKPMTAGAISEKMSLITDHPHAEKTILRKLQNNYLYSHENNSINSSIALILGGHIAKITTGKKNSAKNHNSFYFEPFIDSSHLSMICSSIASNRYLNSDEIDYLIRCELNLSPYYLSLNNHNDSAVQHTDDSFPLPKLPQKPSVPLLNREFKLLQHVNMLYEAINSNCQINLTYGSYNISTKNLRKLQLTKKDKTYIINPFFMMWNNGHYYLIATHKGHQNPVHFRISRMVSITVARDPVNAGTAVPRESLPEGLSAFLLKSHHGKYTLNTAKYTSTYPLMGIYNDSRLIDCVLECTSGTLSILVDTFGHNMPIVPSNIVHTSDEVDIHGNPQSFLAVEIKQVQYDNILMFCLRHHESITAVNPPELAEAVLSRLKASVEKYTAVSKNPPQHPFTTVKS